MANNNSKFVARIPIIPDDFENKDNHKNHELVMDFENYDIYVKKNKGYANITGKIKEDVKQIVDGSAVIHVVTESTVPPIQDREENHWYYIITRSTEQNGSPISSSKYIYYGLIKTEYISPSTNPLIGQNTIIGSDTVQFTILTGYCPCFYIPVNYNASFTNHETGDIVDYIIKDKLYVLNTLSGTYESYNIYLLDLYDPGEYKIDVNLTNITFSISFESNVEDIEGLTLPEQMTVEYKTAIGTIPDPTWTNPRYIFNGWSTDKLVETIIDPLTYKPESDMTLYAWFTYEDDPSLLTYQAVYNVPI